MGLLEIELETGISEHLDANEYGTLAQYPNEQPYQEDIAVTNL
jgi:hypothetical protein